MNLSPLMGKFEGRYSLIAGTFFSTVNALRSVWYLEVPAVLTLVFAFLQVQDQVLGALVALVPQSKTQELSVLRCPQHPKR